MDCESKQVYFSKVWKPNFKNSEDVEALLMIVYTMVRSRVILGSFQNLTIRQSTQDSQMTFDTGILRIPGRTFKSSVGYFFSFFPTCC